MGHMFMMTFIQAGKAQKNITETRATGNVSFHLLLFIISDQSICAHPLHHINGHKRLSLELLIFPLLLLPDFLIPSTCTAFEVIHVSLLLCGWTMLVS